MKQLCLKIHERDNVAVALRDLPAGTQVTQKIILREAIPQAHKIALCDIPAGKAILRYGTIIGYANKNISAGAWINETNLIMPPPPDLSHLEFAKNIVTNLPVPPITTWEGYRNRLGGYGGTRNLLAIHTTVQCAAGVVRRAVNKIRDEILPHYPHIDDVLAITHPYGCGVAIDAPEADVPQRILQNLALHPNFGGVFMLVSLGCEKFMPQRFCAKYPQWNNTGNVIVLQEEQGLDAMTSAIMHMAERKLQKLETRRRESLPISDLLVGMQCGGSDAFSGISANPTAGYAADLLVSGGGTVLFSESTEVRDGVEAISHRCIDSATGKRLVEELGKYDAYLAHGGVDRSANTTPGNKKGGLSNIVEKSMGSIAKSGTSPIVEVLAPGEQPHKHGEIFAATPASDMVCGTCQLASGIGLQVFMTGRGTPYGLAAAPVIKICSRSEMKQQWGDLIDFDAGGVLHGESTIAQQGLALFRYILDVASGKIKPSAEKYGLNNDLCIFNPAPIT